MCAAMVSIPGTSWTALLIVRLMELRIVPRSHRCTREGWTITADKLAKVHERLQCAGGGNLMVEYRTASFAKRNHESMGDYWGAWHTNGENIERCLFDEESSLLATETLEGDVADLVAFARAGADVTTHDAEAARRLSWLQGRQIVRLLGVGESQE